MEEIYNNPAAFFQKSSSFRETTFDYRNLAKARFIKS